jgi:limonene-1,2-epoxide hydrolase
MAAPAPIEVVRDFCDRVAKGDIDALVELFADDAVYHNIPMDPIVGRDAIREALVGFLATLGEMSFDTLHILSDGPVVATERIDHFVRDGRDIALPVAGFFEVDADGRITAWRDYFDMAMFTSQMAG